MKRYGFLFEKAFTKEALYDAYLAASQHKHQKRACFQFEKRLAYNIDRLHKALHDGTYKPMPYYTFMVYEPKPREIYAPSFGDLVVQHAIYAVIHDIFDRSFIDQSYACRRGFGTHKAADYAQTCLQKCAPGTSTVKLDIRKFFYRICRKALRRMIERKIKDRRFVDLMMVFAEYGGEVGIPIGNLLSQIYALIVLNPLDHFIKRVLKARMYCRYVDDFIVFGVTREQCVAYKDRIVLYLRETLGLELSRYTIAPIKRGVNFVGYRTWASARFVRKHSLFKFRRAAVRDKLESVVSILGHARRTHSFKQMVHFLKENHNGLYRRLPKAYRQRYHQGTAPAYG